MMSNSSEIELLEKFYTNQLDVTRKQFVDVIYRDGKKKAHKFNHCIHLLY